MLLLQVVKSEARWPPANRPDVSDACLRCQAESKQDARYGRQDCVVVWGECNHSFHYCCMSLWVKQNNRCPLCQQEWSIQRMGK
ncbi:RING-box protein 1A [Gryllus bimaculatus]|nr:RING-box protein 1A [Gryllus bimaculatus]